MRSKGSLPLLAAALCACLVGCGDDVSNATANASASKAVESAEAYSSSDNYPGEGSVGSVQKRPMYPTTEQVIDDLVIVVDGKYRVPIDCGFDGAFAMDTCGLFLPAGGVLGFECSGTHPGLVLQWYDRGVFDEAIAKGNSGDVNSVNELAWQDWRTDEPIVLDTTYSLRLVDRDINVVVCRFNVVGVGPTVTIDGDLMVGKTHPPGDAVGDVVHWLETRNSDNELLGFDIVVDIPATLVEQHVPSLPLPEPIRGGVAWYPPGKYESHFNVESPWGATSKLRHRFPFVMFDRVVRQPSEGRLPDKGIDPRLDIKVEDLGDGMARVSFHVRTYFPGFDSPIFLFQVGHPPDLGLQIHAPREAFLNPRVIGVDQIEDYWLLKTERPAG